MDSLKSPRSSCITCGKKAGMFTCRGCSKIFCVNHANEHRQELEANMNEILSNHDHLKQYVTSKKLEKYHQQLLEQIDQWEEHSIDKIHRAAEKVRQQVLNIARESREHTEDKLSKLTQQIKKAQYDGDFFEQDVKRWKIKIKDLQAAVVEQKNIQISRLNSADAFISKILLTEKTTDNQHQSLYELKIRTDSIGIQDRSKVNQLGEYLSGDHLFRFKFTHYKTSSLLLIGVVSKSQSKIQDPLKNPTFYGWSNNNVIYLHGIAYDDTTDYRNDIKKGDVLQMVLDCDRKLIRLKNERTLQTHELSVNIHSCPLPWKPHVLVSNDI